MTMKKLFIYLFIMTAGLLSATQVSAQKEIAPEVIKLQKGEIESTSAPWVVLVINVNISLVGLIFLSSMF